ncbi:MAG: PPOX class F420-dependent oxidoreductase [Actinomycetota bacterium]
MARSMTPEEVRSFLMEGTRTAKVATVRVDGSPHVAPVWFVLDGDDVIFTTGKTSVKGRTLARERRAALTVDDERAPFSFVVVEGPVDLSDGVDVLLARTTRIAARYLPDQAEEYGRRNAAAGELLVRLRPDRVMGETGLTD